MTVNIIALHNPLGHTIAICQPLQAESGAGGEPLRDASAGTDMCGVSSHGLPPLLYLLKEKHLTDAAHAHPRSVTAVVAHERVEQGDCIPLTTVVFPGHP